MSDVSCRAFGFYVECARRGLIDLDELLEGSTFSREYLSNSWNRVPWDYWVTLCERFSELVDHDHGVLEESATWSYETALRGHVTRNATRLMKPIEVYEFALNRVTAWTYLNIDITTQRVGENVLEVTVTVPGYNKGSLAWMVMFRGAIRYLTVRLGLEESHIVTSSISTHGLHVMIYTPRPRGVLHHVRDVVERFVPFVSLYTEVTHERDEIRRSFDDLRAVELQWRSVLDVLPSAACVHTDGFLHYLNPAFGALLELDNVSIEEKTVQLRDFVHPGDAERFEELLEATARVEDEVRFLRRNGGTRDVHLTFLPNDVLDSRQMSLLHARDVSQERSITRELVESQRTLQALSQSLPDLVLRLSKDGRIVDFIAGSEHKEASILRHFVGLQVVEATAIIPNFKNGPLVACLNTLDLVMRTGEAQNVEFAIRWPPEGDSERHFDCRLLPLSDPTEEIVVLVRDISHRRRLEDQLAVSERMASLGTLAAGVAHEINNPLTYVQCNIVLALEDLEDIEVDGEDAEALAKSLEVALEGTDRVANIVRELKNFSRVEEPQLSNIDLHDLLESAINLSMNELRHRAELERDFVEEDVAVFGDPHQLVQVFVNLLINAAQSFDDFDQPSPLVRVKTSVVDGKVHVAIKDNGCGMSSKTMRRIFDPFFTTKTSSGTGLGLSVCHRIVGGLEGRIDVESKVGEGATMTVVLPSAEPAKQLALDAVLEPYLPLREGAHIMIIDDEKGVRDGLARVLEHHDVSMFSTVDGAIEYLDYCTPDLILCDLMIPGSGGGEEFFGTVVAKHPALRDRIIFISGGVFTPSAEAFLKLEEPDVIQKPFAAGEIRQLIDAKLEQS